MQMQYNFMRLNSNFEVLGCKIQRSKNLKYVICTLAEYKYTKIIKNPNFHFKKKITQTSYIKINSKTIIFELRL